MMSAESSAPPLDVTLHRAIDHATAALIEIRYLSRFAMTQAERDDFARTEQKLRLLADELVVLRDGAERPLAFSTSPAIDTTDIGTRRSAPSDS